MLPSASSISKSSASTTASLIGSSRNQGYAEYSK